MFEPRSLKGCLVTHTLTNGELETWAVRMDWKLVSTLGFYSKPGTLKGCYKALVLTSCDHEVPLSHPPHSHRDTMYTPQQNKGGMC
jgi:hypothetical protein